MFIFEIDKRKIKENYKDILISIANSENISIKHTIGAKIYVRDIEGKICHVKKNYINGLPKYMIILPEDYGEYTDYFKRQILKYCAIEMITLSIADDNHVNLTKDYLRNKYSCIISEEDELFDQYKKSPVNIGDRLMIPSQR